MSDLKKLREGLRIDDNELDRCLVDQPGLFYRVADLHALAIADRDAVKLDLEEAMAAMDEQLRREAMDAEEKVTENQIKQRLQAAPEIKELRRELINANTEVNRLGALENAYHQRSGILRKLVDKQVSELYTLSIERGSKGARTAIADSVRDRAGELRRSRGQ